MLVVLLMGFALVVLARTRNRIVVVTDQAVVVLEAGLFASRTPSGPVPLVRLPRRTVLGPPRGFVGSMSLAGEKVWIPFRHHKDVAAANAGLAQL
ncbi:hypothetical protein CcI49_15595 [Frankia sp. CcI49]|nr:hypothetical protein ACG83_35085 [Frankia sp. R43]ONH59687.1 hypothetical protein CcI49_15595 [Frankia sp. CcI49]